MVEEEHPEGGYNRRRDQIEPWTDRKNVDTLLSKVLPSPPLPFYQLKWVYMMTCNIGI